MSWLNLKGLLVSLDFRALKSVVPIQRHAEISGSEEV